MGDLRRHIYAIEDVLVPLLVQHGGSVTQAARLQTDTDQALDEERIEAIIQRVRSRTAAEGGQPEVLEAIYRSMMEAYIDFEHREFARLRAPAQGSQP